MKKMCSNHCLHRASPLPVSLDKSWKHETCISSSIYHLEWLSDLHKTKGQWQGDCWGPPEKASLFQTEAWKEEAFVPSVLPAWDPVWGPNIWKHHVKMVIPFNFIFFSISGWSIDFDYCDIKWFALEMNWDHSVVFEMASKYIYMHIPSFFRYASKYICTSTYIHK